MTMLTVAMFLFWLGVVATFVVGIISFIVEETKRGVASVPFMLLAAAAVAKYLAM